MVLHSLLTIFSIILSTRFDVSFSPEEVYVGFGIHAGNSGGDSGEQLVKSQSYNSIEYRLTINNILVTGDVSRKEKREKKEKYSLICMYIMLLNEKARVCKLLNQCHYKFIIDLCAVF